MARICAFLELTGPVMPLTLSDPSKGFFGPIWYNSLRAISKITVQRRHALQQRQSIRIFGVNPVRDLVTLTFAFDQVTLAQPVHIVGDRCG